MIRCEVPLGSINTRPGEVRGSSILLCLGDGGGGQQAGEKRRQAGEVSQPSFTQISAGRGGSPALSRPHVPAPRVPIARGSPTRNPGTQDPALSASRLREQPPRPRSALACSPRSWAGPRTLAGPGRPRGGEKGTRVARATGGGAHYVTGPGGNNQWGGVHGLC